MICLRKEGFNTYCVVVLFRSSSYCAPCVASFSRLSFTTKRHFRLHDKTPFQTPRQNSISDSTTKLHSRLHAKTPLLTSPQNSTPYSTTRLHSRLHAKPHSRFHDKIPRQTALQISPQTPRQNTTPDSISIVLVQ